MDSLNAPSHRAFERNVHQLQANHMDRWNRQNLGQHYHHPLHANGRSIGTYGQALRELSEDAWPFHPNDLRGRPMPEERRLRRAALLEADRRGEIPVTFRPRITPPDPAHDEHEKGTRKELKRRNTEAPQSSRLVDTKLVKRSEEHEGRGLQRRMASDSEAPSETTQSEGYYKRKPLKSLSPARSGSWKKWLGLGVGALAVTGGSRFPMATHPNAFRTGSSPLHGMQLPLYNQPPLVREQMERLTNERQQQTRNIAERASRQMHARLRDQHVAGVDRLNRERLGDRYHQEFPNQHGDPTGMTYGEALRQRAHQRYPEYPYGVTGRARTEEESKRFDEDRRQRGEKTTDEIYAENDYRAYRRRQQRQRESMRPTNRSGAGY